MHEWLGGTKHSPALSLTREWHERFSQVLADFSLDHARDIVEGHQGQLVYAGGDDVLAMLPAESAVSCAACLAERFRHTVNPVAPGATASVGLAIGHIKAPLQDMVWAAQAAETRAKRPVGNRGGLGRNALAVSLFKRSGELVEWGAQFDSPALGLLAFFQTHFRESPGAGNTKPVISGRFPHVLIERLGNLGWNAQLASTPPGSSKSLLEVAKAEFDWVVHRQTGIGLTAPNESGLKTLREDLCRRGHSCLDALARVGATLGHFASLFAVEAFINQQLD